MNFMKLFFFKIINTCWSNLYFEGFELIALIYRVVYWQFYANKFFDIINTYIYQIYILRALNALPWFLRGVYW
jgi:hypothetical protein